MSQGGGGSEKSSKQCNVLLEWPLTTTKLRILADNQRFACDKPRDLLKHEIRKEEEIVSLFFPQTIIFQIHKRMMKKKRTVKPHILMKY